VNSWAEHADLLVRPHGYARQPEPWMSDPAVIVDALLDSIPTRPAWHHLAACRGRTELFYPVKGVAQADLAEARRICARCPVFDECRENSIDELHGIWAGLSVRERAEARRARRKAS
jgi:WhiB family redox-sensing transcriptional regulator